MKNLIHIFILLFSLSFFACEKPANIELPEGESKPVMYCWLSPDDSTGITVYLTYSNPYFNNPNRTQIMPIRNALVKIKNSQGQEAVLTESTIPEEEGYYLLNFGVFPLQSGETYTVTASNSSFNIEGSTTIPNPTSLNDVVYEQLGMDEFGYMQFALISKWLDRAGERNFYRLYFDSKYTFQPGDTNYSAFADQLVTDQNRDGKEITARLMSSFYQGFQTEMYLDAYLLTTDGAYHEYHQRRLSYYGEDPFSEPLPMYNNVKGGLGTVGSYRRILKPIKVVF